MQTIVIFVIMLVISITFNSHASELEPLSFKRETVNGLSRLKDESSDFLKTPFQTDNGNLLLTFGFISAVGVTYAFDTDIRNQFNRSKNSSLDIAADIGAIMGDPYLHLGIAALVYGGAIANDSAKWKEVGEMLGEALILADTSTLILKEVTGRGRPLVTVHKGDFKPFEFKNNYDAFPSMHTASSFAMASVLASTSESMALKISSYGAATVVGLSRIYQNKHWASDTLLAAILGELSGRIVTSYHAGNKNTAFVPQAFHNGAGIAMVRKW